MPPNRVPEYYEQEVFSRQRESSPGLAQFLHKTNGARLALRNERGFGSLFMVLEDVKIVHCLNQGLARE